MSFLHLQYPLDMGKPDVIRSNKTLAVSVNAEGQVNYDAIVKQGSNRNKVVYTDHKSLVPKLDKLGNKEVSWGSTTPNIPHRQPAIVACKSSHMHSPQASSGMAAGPGQAGRGGG